MKDADIVVFIASQLHNANPTFPPHKRNTSLYMLHTMEQPKYVPLLHDHKYLKTHFDLLATFYQPHKYFDTGIANIPLTYYPLHAYKAEDVLNPSLPFHEKTGYGSSM